MTDDLQAVEHKGELSLRFDADEFAEKSVGDPPELRVVESPTEDLCEPDFCGWLATHAT